MVLPGGATESLKTPISVGVRRIYATAKVTATRKRIAAATQPM
jgi:hypothetical protein